MVFSREDYCQKQPPDVFCKNMCSLKFRKFHMCSSEISEILKNTYFQEHLRTTASLLQQQFHSFFPTLAARFSK